MSGLFKSPEVKSPPPPKVVRMPKPVGEDPNAEKAAAKFRAGAAARQGRRATILTDSLKEMTGSSGKSLGG